MSWKREKLKNVCEFIDGDRGKNYPSNGELFDNGDCLFLNTGNVTATGFDFTSCQFIADEKDRALRKGKLLRGDVVLTTRGTLGHVAYYSDAIPFDRIRINSGMLIARSSVHLLPNYLFYAFRDPMFQAMIDGVRSGSAQPQLPAKTLKEMTIPVPTLEEQKRIADILSAYDKLIENNRTQIALLEEAAQRLYKEWFVDLRFPGHETTPIHDGLPEGWRNGLLGDIVSFVSGYAFKSSSFSKEGNYKVVTIKNVLDGKFDGNGMDLIIDLPKNMTSECILHQGDILISLTGNVGRVCLVIGENCLLNQRVAKIKTRAKAFTYCFFRLKATKALLENMSSGTAQKNLSTVKALQMSIMIPDERLIRLFELNAKPLLDAIVNLESQIEYTREACDRLLPKLMSGEIEVG